MNKLLTIILLCVHSNLVVASDKSALRAPTADQSEADNKSGHRQQTVNYDGECNREIIEAIQGWQSDLHRYEKEIQACHQMLQGNIDNFTVSQISQIASVINKLLPNDDGAAMLTVIEKQTADTKNVATALLQQMLQDKKKTVESLITTNNRRLSFYAALGDKNKPKE